MSLTYRKSSGRRAPRRTSACFGSRGKINGVEIPGDHAAVQSLQHPWPCSGADACWNRASSSDRIGTVHPADLSAECLEGIISQLPWVHLAKVALTASFWARSVRCSEAVWRGWFMSEFWAHQTVAGVGVAGGRRLPGLPAAAGGWRRTFQRMVTLMRKQYVAGDSTMCVQMTRMNQEIDSSIYRDLVDLNIPMYNLRYEQQADAVLFPLFSATRDRIERQGLRIEKEKRLEEHGINPSLADASVSGGSLTFSDLLQPPAREDRTIRFEDSAWHDVITPTYIHEGYDPSSTTTGFINNTVIQSDAGIRQLFEDGRIQEPAPAPENPSDSVQKRLTRGQLAAQSIVNAQNDRIKAANAATEAVIIQESRAMQDLDEDARIQLLSELVRWIMGKHVCALEEKGRRWITHDIDVLNEPHPVTFVVLHPLFVHPLIEHSLRKLAYFEAEVVGAASVGIGHHLQHLHQTIHIGLEPGSYAYHSIDGSKWSNCSGEPYGPMYGGAVCEPYDDVVAPRSGEGDFVGCGVDMETKEVFFTLNGVMLGVAYQGIDLYDANQNVQLHPCVALDESDHEGGADRFRINCGSEPFKFDLMAYRAVKLPPPDPAQQQDLVVGGLGAEELDDDLMDAEGETFEMVNDLVLCCLDVVMNDAQKEAAGLVNLDDEQAAFAAAAIMISAEYDVWPEWLKVFFQLTEDGEVEPLFEAAVFEQWLGDQVD